MTTKRLLLLAVSVLMLTTSLQAQDASELRSWKKKGEWKQGCDKAKAHKTLNWHEFYTQYEKNPTQWKAVFQWLRDTDLQAIPKGKYPIPGTTLEARVEDSENLPLEKRNTESHRKKADFQLVVKGTEGFALLDHASSTISKPYDEKKDVMRYDYVKEKTNFFDVKGGQFVIFFPSDWHIAKVQTKKKDQNIRVIVIKVDYIE